MRDSLLNLMIEVNKEFEMDEIYFWKQNIAFTYDDIIQKCESCQNDQENLFNMNGWDLSGQTIYVTIGKQYIVFFEIKSR